MTRTYRAGVFACFYFGILSLLAVFWFWFGPRSTSTEQTWGAVILIIFAVLGSPFLRARVTIDASGITQQICRRRNVKWDNIISWQRRGDPHGEGPETITLTTRTGSFTLNHNCVYGKRLDEIESELRNRLAVKDVDVT